MNIDLNSPKYKYKPIVTKEGILEHLDDIIIYRSYANGINIQLNTNIISPLRPLEEHPSFGFFEVKNTYEILFQDFTLNIKGDCIKFVQLMLSLNYFEALSQIVNDFKLDEYFMYKKPKITNLIDIKLMSNYKTLVTRKIKKNIEIKTRDWNLSDISFWRSYGINKDVLKIYNVIPVDYIFINTNTSNKIIIKADKYAYAFIENKDNNLSYKIYQPFNTKYKWINTHNNSVWQGWEQLPKTGEKLIITKSLKDVMAITENLNIPAVSLQTEGVLPKYSVMDELNMRFKNLYLFYDNDFDKEVNWGRKFGDIIEEKFSVFRIEVPDIYESKDFSDLLKNKGIKEGIKIINKVISNILPF